MRELYTVDALADERGGSPLKTLVVLLVVAAIGFFGLKFGGAYLDIDGAEKDLNAKADELSLHCVGDRRCENRLIEEIDELREFHNRNIKYDFTTMKLFAGENLFTIEGTKVIDLVFTKREWRFTIEVQKL